MSIGTFLYFLAAYLVVRTLEKVYAIYYTIQADKDIKRIEGEQRLRQQAAQESLDRLVKGLKSPEPSKDDFLVN